VEAVFESDYIIIALALGILCPFSCNLDGALVCLGTGITEEYSF